MERLCPDCNSPIFGRRDRKFCSDACRTNYHNIRLREKMPLVRKVNTILLRNRKILESFLSHGKSTVSQSELLASGYSLFWNTGQSRSSGTPCVSLVYEYSLEELPDGQFKICRSDWLWNSLQIAPE
ncbi:MAG: hypothetical protein U0T82_03420 [Bacteroidales bacterium]